MRKKMFKKLISLMLSFLIVISILPFDVIRNNILSLKTEAAYVEDHENAYIENHMNFIISGNYNNLINNASFYNAIWRYEEDSPNFTAYATWEILGDIGEIASLNFNDLFVTQNPYDVILMEILSSNTFSENIVKSSEKILKHAFSAKDIYENLLKILRTSDEWEDSMELDISKELNDMIASCGSSLIDGIVFSAEEYDLKHKNRNVYEILTKILPTVSDNSWNNLFSKINNINTISSYINTGTDIIFTFFDAYQKYLIVDSLVTTNREALDLLLNTSYKMEPKSRAMLNESLNKILEGVNYDSAFNAICNYSVNNLSKTTYSFFREGLSKIVYNIIGKVFGVSSNIAGSINKVVFAYNTTYTILDHISGLGSASDLFNLMHAAALLEKKMLKTVTTYADNLIDSSTLEDAVKFDSGWSLLQSLNTYSYNALSSYISSLKKNYSLILSFDLSFQLTTGITSTFWVSAFNEVVNSIKNFKEKINAADASIEASVYLEGEWKNANCHKNRSSDIPSKMVYVKCPTDVFVYNSQEELVLSIVSNKIEAIGEHITANIDNGEKIIYLPSDQKYNIKIEATDDGQMDYGIIEFIENNAMRSVNFDDVTLKKGNYYIAQVDNIVYTSNENYELKSDGDTVKVTYDSLPPKSNQITDIIISEELFDDFSIELIDKVANAMFKFEPVVDIASYNISTDDTVALFSAISKYYPTEYSLLTKSDFNYKIIFSPSLGCITDIRFYYGDDANLEAFEQRNKDLKAEIDKIVARVEGMDDFEKALYIHDYIVLNSEYDLELLKMLESGGTLSGELYAEKYSEYSILINGTGICGSYALAYRALMNATGVDCLYLSSQQMNHAWNMVKIDGEWYHVDCCWDDPVPDNYGDARRTYFLRNDKEIMELNHYSWVPGYYKATSKLYSDMPRNYNFKQKYDSGYWYVSDNTGIFKTDRHGNNKETVLDVNATSIEVENGELYYSLSGKMFFYDQQTKKTITAYSIPDSQYDIYSERAYVKNFDVEEDVIIYYLVKYSDGETTCKKYTGTNQKDLYEKVKKISLQQSKYEMNVFDTISLDVEIESESEDDYILSWNSSDVSVASVTNDGVVRGNGSGTAVITVSYGDLKDSCEVIVTSDVQTGYCGSNVIWEFTEETGHLLITGTGDMYAFELLTVQPWLDFNIISVEIGPGVTSVGRNAFQNKSLNKVILGKNIKNIDDNAFAGCTELTETSFPSELKRIGKDAFRDCEKLTSVYIPQNVTEIGEYAFNGIDSLESFTVSSNNTTYKCDEFGVLYSKDGTRLICFPENCSLTEYTVPSNVTNIEYKSFYSCENLEKIVVKGDLLTTGYYTFYGCKSLKEIIFEGSLQEIGDHSFHYCTSLETFYAPDEVTGLGDYSFSNCESLMEIRLPDSLKEIGNFCFENCKKLEGIQLPENLERMGNGVFYSCNSIESIYIPDGVDFIQGFSGTDSLTVTMSGLLGMFSDYNIYNIYTLDYEAEDFWQTNFGIQDSTMSTVGLEVEYLLSAQNPTFDCSELNYISVGSENSVFSSDENGVLFNKDKTVLIRMPRNSGVTEYAVPDSVVSIAFSAFENCDNLQKVTIPDSVTHIGNKAFAECDNLKSISVPDTVDKIREGTFYNCSSLKQIVIPDSVTEIRTEAFSNCESLSTVSIPESVALLEYCAFSDCDNLEYVEFLGATVGNESFVNCNKLEEIVLSDNVTCISALAFADLPSLRKIVWSDNLQEIQDGAFKNCDSISSVILPNSVTVLRIGVFEDCDGILAVSIGSGISAIPERTFRDCDGLKSILIPQTVTQLQATAFIKCDSLEKMAILNPSCTISSPGIFSSGYFDYVNSMSKKICTLWGHSGSTAETFSKKAGGFVASFKPFTEAPHVHEFFAIEYDANEASKNKQYHNICYCGFHDGELVSELFNCELGGFKGTRCAFCGLEQGETVEATQHRFVFKNETHGTCINPGIEIYECMVCGHTEEIEKSADEGHSYTETITAPTCSEIGYTTATCEHCGENAMYDFVPMLGHDVTATHTDADCKMYAQTEYSCSRCDYHEIIVDEESGLGEHKISVTVTEATCTENGSIDRICVTCNELISTEVVASNGHIPGEWETSTDATTESAGKKEKRCIVCKELVEEEEIPKIPVYVSGVALSESEIEISNKETYLLSATVSPENADDRTVTWVSADPSVATVNENGLVTAVSIGETTVSVTTTDGGYTASCAVTVIPREFDITWVVGGHKTVETYKEGSLLKKPSDPVETGYTFTGWTPEVPDIMPAEDLTFTATWKANTYDAVFDADGGKWADGASEKTVPTVFNSLITVPEAPTKQGYIFSKWSSEVGVMDSVDGKTFVAEWIAATDTHYIVETYTMNTSGEYVKTTKAFKGTTGESVSVKPTVQTGFTLNKSKSVLSGNVAGDNSLVLKVYIDRNTYTLTTVADGVSTSTRYLYGSLIAEPATPVKTGYKFIKWDKTLPETMPAKNITLTAVFDTAYTCPDCGDEIVGESAIAEHIAAEARAKSTVSIKNNPDTKTIKYGETLRLTAIASKPDDVVICWYVDGAKKGEGTTFDLTFESGTKTVEVKLEDADGNIVCNSSGAKISDSEEVTVNAGFFQKIISFFKNLFRMDRTVVQ